MPRLVSRGRPLTYPVATCDDLAKYVVRAKERLAWAASAPDKDIEAWYRTVADALDQEKGKRREALRKLESAVSASGGTLGRLARVALVDVADLLLAFAVQTRNPALIGSAVGLDIAVDTSEFVIQVISRENGATTLEAVVVFIKGRASMVVTLVSGPGKTFLEKQLELIKAVTEAMASLGEAVLNEAQLKGNLGLARRALDAMQSKAAGLPGSLKDTRQFMKDHLEAEIRFLELLRSAYPSQKCRFDLPSGPA